MTPLFKHNMTVEQSLFLCGLHKGDHSTAAVPRWLSTPAWGQAEVKLIKRERAGQGKSAPRRPPPHTMLSNKELLIIAARCIL